METADVFYNREDLLAVPRQPGGDGISNDDPLLYHHAATRRTASRVFLMIPMDRAPRQHDRVARRALRRARLRQIGLSTRFPKEKLVLRPFQIEARINQNTEISQQLTLWNQMGLGVIRGANLLVISDRELDLYVSPLYLRAQQGHLPELKRVIAAYGEHVVMKETLAEALSALFVESPVRQQPQARRRRCP